MSKMKTWNIQETMNFFISKQTSYDAAGNDYNSKLVFKPQ